ncbi:MAG: hypothetical protein DI535_00710 [Citrobacter freundii]|nr:MAG: hypothetical protein DI535_00710 [Citrobacter freundii]
MLPTFKHLGEEDAYVLDVKEINNFRNYHFKIIMKDEDISIETYCAALHDYFDWYLLYCDGILNGKEFKDEQVIPHIFRPEHKTLLQQKEFWAKSMYISREYVAYLKGRISASNIARYQHALSSLSIDLEELIIHYEVKCRRSITKGILTSGRYPFLRPTDIYYAARSLFYIEECADVTELYLRDLKPVVMFQIRQTLEVFAKNLIGYTAIIDPTGSVVKKFTQVAWEFIQHECQQASPRISFPFDLHTILPIHKWSNSFVHSTYIYSSFIQAYALKVLGRLFKPSDKPIKEFDGSSKIKLHVAAIQLSQYDSLRTDFGRFITDKMSGARVEWMDVKDVGAYIISR